jgi:hypothetical protein
MIVAISVFELHIPAARSLKEKRRVVKATIERIHSRYRVSIAETAYHDLHQRAEIAIALVHSGEREAERVLEEIRRILDQQPEAILTLWNPQFVEAAP